MSKKIIIPYFPKGLKYTTPVALGGAIWLMTLGYYVFAIVLLVACLIVLTTNYVTEIDLSGKRYRDYISLAGIPVSVEETSFRKINHIVITKGKHSQVVNTRVQSRQLDWSDYTATLILDNQPQLNLLTRNDKADLLAGIKDIARFLEVPVEDHTTTQPRRIDIANINHENR